MVYTFTDIITMFLEGAESGRAGSRTNPGNLSIRGNQLFHYTTPIMERTENEYIINLTRYSIQTGRLQKQLKEILADVSYTTVLKVPRDYEGSLSDFLKVSKEV